MFQQLEINISDQWQDTSLGTLVESAIFYRQVRLKTPIVRLIKLLSSAPHAIDFLVRLIDEGHVSIEIEQFPAGELANDLGLLSSALTNSLKAPLYDKSGALILPAVPDVPISEIMAREYDFNGRLIDKIRIEVLGRWELADDPTSIRSAEALISHLKRPNIDEITIREKLLRLQSILEYGRESLFQELVATGDGGKTESIRVTGEKNLLGLSFPVIGTSSPISPASLLKSVSFAGFLIDHIDLPEYGDVFTGDRFNSVMRSIYGRNIKLLTGQNDIETFQSTVLRTTPIREFYDEGKISDSKIWKALETKDSLVGALAGKTKDVSISEWYFEQRNNTLIPNTPRAKTVRFGAFTAGGLALDVVLTGGFGTAAGVVLGAFDAFVLDKLTKRGGPTTFVEGPLRDLIPAANTG